MSLPESNPPKSSSRRGFFFRFKKFNTKFMLVTGASVLIGAVLNLLVARHGIQKLSAESSREIEAGLNDATREYLTNHMIDTVRRADYMLGHAYADLEILADIAQGMVDRNEDLQPLYDRIGAIPLFQRKLVYHEKSNWYQNEPGDPSAITVWGYLGDHGAVRPEVLKAIDSTALLDLIVPSFQRRGADKLQLYYVGSMDMPYARMTPYTDTGTFCDQTSPGHNEKNWYDFFWPSLVEGWQSWLKDPEELKKRKTQVTVTAPYADAAGGGLIVTAFHPLWSKDRKGFAGIVGMDRTIDQFIASIKDVKLAQTGFAFLAQADSNVLAINDLGANTLGLQTDRKEVGLTFLQRHLKSSKEPEVAALELPKDEEVVYRDITIGGAPHVIVLRRIQPQNSFAPGAGISTDYWTLGFVVPKREIYATLIAAQKAIEQTRRSIVTSQAVIGTVSFVILMLGVYLVSRRMTGALVELSRGATRMRTGDYGVHVDVTSEDEVGQLSVAFNDMANEIQAYTSNLEELVRARTRALEDANQEIRDLNAKLAQENLRLGAELNVARQLQMMVLPAERELREVPGLDIAGYMAPADEVGGDYYDVLRGTEMVKIGIGDVTGHGLESGVLMLMVQTAVRTLLASNERDPRRFLNIVNKVIYQNVKRINSDKNLTLVLIDYNDGVLHLTGQHEDVIIVRNDGRLERVDTTGLGIPVGLEFDISDFIANMEIRLDPGDVVTLFTDGVTEADDTDSNQYGVERLCDVVVENHTKTSEQIKEAIINDVMSHIGGNKIYDDITVLVIKRL